MRSVECGVLSINDRCGYRLSSAKLKNKVKKCTNFHIGAPGYDPHCHCEVSAHAGVVTAGNAFGAIRFPFAQADFTEILKKIDI